MKSLKTWVQEHDERWSFILIYVGLAVALSIFMSLFWVALLMFGHFLLELWRQAQMTHKPLILHALWEVKLDIGLLLFALSISLYAELLMSALGLGQLARGAQVAARFAIIEQAMRTVLLTMDEAALMLRAIGRRKKTTQKEIKKHEKQVEQAYPWRRPGKGDWFSIGFLAACLVLMLVSPVFTGYSLQESLNILKLEMTP